MSTPKICVVGSINMDLAVTTEVVPKQGETILGEKFATYPGGKGANQAVAAARLGAKVSLISAVGKDTFGESLMSHLHKEGICTKGVSVMENEATGIANIILSEKDNRIIVVPGANSYVTPALVEKHQDQIKASDVVLLQFEIPLETVTYTVELAKEHGVKVIVNPAPFQEVSEELFAGATYFTPNEHEVGAMKHDPLFSTVKKKMIVTLGEKGVRYVDEHGRDFIIPAYKVHPIDTTGAGDTFNGALATEIARGEALPHAISFANAAAALSITKLGAQQGMPTRAEVTQFLMDRGHK